MKLIDADMLKKYMMDNGKETERFLRCIDEQPTAYDANKEVGIKIIYFQDIHMEL